MKQPAVHQKNNHTCKASSGWRLPDGKCRDGVLYGIVLLSVAVVFTSLECLMPQQLDDLAFIGLYRYMNGGGDDFSLNAFSGYFQEMRNFDNSRISNQLAPLSTIIHPWCDIFPYLCGIVMAFNVAAITRLSGSRLRRSVTAVSVWAMMILFLPWRNSILVADYMLNYTWSTAVTLLFLWLFVRKLQTSESKIIIVVTVLMAVIAGGWHEGFALPVLCGLGVDWIASRCRKSWKWYLVAGVYAVSAMAFALSPGTLARFGSEMSDGAAASALKTVADLSLVILFVASVGLFSISKSGRAVMKDCFRSEIFRIMSVSCIAAALLSLAVTHTPRTAFWPEMCALFCMVSLYGRLLSGESFRRGIAVCAVLLYVACMAQSVTVILWQQRYYKEAETIMSELKRSKTGTVFYDIIDPDSLPVYTLYMNPKTSWVTGFNFHCLNRALGDWGNSVVPTSLKHPSEGSRSVSESGEIFATGDALWTHYITDIDISGVTDLNVRLKGGETRVAKGTMIPFISLDGDTLTYIKIFKTPVADIEDVEVTGYPRLTPVKAELRRVGRPFLEDEDAVIKRIERKKK